MDVLRFLKGTDWSLFADLVSPAFFQVLPGSVLRDEVGRLFRSARDGRGFAALRERRSADVARVGIRWVERLPPTPRARVRSAGDGGASPGPSELDRRDAGQAVLRLYFHQLLRWDEVVVDLRRAAFVQDGDAFAWAPRALWSRWEPGFVGGLRELYRGFYLGDDARFRAGLRATGLSAGEDVFRQTFGDGDQSRVRFSLRAFQETFHTVFVRCREAGARLPGGVLPLGLTLGSVYEHLESLGGEHDVRAAFSAVAG